MDFIAYRIGGGIFELLQVGWVPLSPHMPSILRCALETCENQTSYHLKIDGKAVLTLKKW
jgi:hypothetical protein